VHDGFLSFPRRRLRRWFKRQEGDSTQCTERSKAQARQRQRYRSLARFVPLPAPMSTAVSPVAVARHRPKHKHRPWLWLIAFLVIVALGFAGYTAATLGIAYSSGERTGYVQKLSRKGWVCKTYEGELAMTTVPGTAPQIFNFTVRDQKVARAIEDASGSEVILDYDQHVGVPTNCFGETEYFVTNVRKVAP
jgi:hypothetical protein